MGGWDPWGGGWPPSSDPPRCLLQALTVFQRSLTTMQMQTQGLIQFALPLFPMAEVWGGGSGVWSPVPIVLTLLFSTERPAGGPAAAQHLRDQPASAHGPAGLPRSAQGEGGPGHSHAASRVPQASIPTPSHCCRTTWTLSLASATMAWRGCSTWCSSPCWWPPPFPPWSVLRRVPGGTWQAGGGSADPSLAFCSWG